MSDNSRDHRHGHRDRLRQRFATGGLSALLEYEALELLLTFAVPRIDTKPIAKSLLRRFGSVQGVLDAPEDELSQVVGVGRTSAQLIRLVREFAVKYGDERASARPEVSTLSELVDLARRKTASLRHEVFGALFLSPHNELLSNGVEIVHEGTVDRTQVYARDVIQQALTHAATKLVFVHNHPFSEADPSPEDVALTRTLYLACRFADLEVVDHLIITNQGFYSFAQHGEMELLEQEFQTQRTGRSEAGQ